MFSAFGADNGFGCEAYVIVAVALHRFWGEGDEKLFGLREMELLFFDMYFKLYAFFDV